MRVRAAGYVTMNYVASGATGPVAFALFVDGSHAQAALSAMRGQTIADTPVQVEIARRSLRQDVPGRGGGGGGGSGGGGSGGGAVGEQRSPPPEEEERRTCRRMETERSYPY